MTNCSQPRAKSSLPFHQQIGREEEIGHDPTTAHLLPGKEGTVLELEPIDPGNLKKGMQGFGGKVSTALSMKHQQNPRDVQENPQTGRAHYQEKLQAELGLPGNNPYPQQPATILENTDKRPLQTRTPQITSMKVNQEPQVPI